MAVEVIQETCYLSKVEEVADLCQQEENGSWPDLCIHLRHILHAVFALEAPVAVLPSDC
jgi:hypothetical protein